MPNRLSNYGYSYEYRLQHNGKWFRQIVWCRSEEHRDNVLPVVSKIEPRLPYVEYRKFEKRIR